MKLEVIKFVSGEEVIAELVSKDSTDGTITIKDPMKVMPTMQGQLSFIPMANFSDAVKQEYTFDNCKIMYTYEADNKKIIGGYKQAIETANNVRTKNRSGLDLKI